jgi:hypothetical protein
MTDLKKNPGTYGPTPLPTVAYKRSWSEKVGPTPDLDKPDTEASGDAEAAEDVNDLDRSRGALLRVIDILRSFSSIPIMGADAPLFLKKGDSTEMNPTSTKILFLVDRSHPLRK